MPDLSDWKDSEKPLTQANRSGEFSFTAPHTATFLVQITFPYESKEHFYTSMKQLKQEARKSRRNAFACQILDANERVSQNYYGPVWLPYEEENIVCLDSFEAVEGHRYTIRVAGNSKMPVLRTLRPVAKLTYNPAMEDYKHRHESENFWSILLLFTGVSLTFFGNSRIPLRGWFRTKP